MYYAIFPNKDTTITNVSIDNTSKTGSNSGLSEILELYVLTASVSNRGKSRILLQFDLNPLSESISSGLISTGSIEYRLKLKNSYHHETVPTSFNLEVYPMSQSWDEGVGLSMYDENLKDSGWANWDNSTRLISWDTAGGTYVLLSGANQSFDTGQEDLDVDISDMVTNIWLNDTIPNSGVIIKFIDAHETGSTDLYVKKFYSRHAHVHERRPRIEVFSEDVLQDDRAMFPIGQSGSLYYYRFVNGIAQNLPAGDVIVDIERVSGTSSFAITSVTASFVSTGVYHASGTFIPDNGTNVTTDTYRDIWSVGGVQYFTGSFTTVYATGSGFFDYDDFSISLGNLHEVYNNDQRVTVNVFGRRKDYAPAVRVSSSTKPTPFVFREAYYQIENEETEEIIVPFSTGSVKHSKLSYDENGNYFELWTSAFVPDSIYRIKILVEYNNQKFVFDKDWTFRIEE